MINLSEQVTREFIIQATGRLKVAWRLSELIRQTAKTIKKNSEKVNTKIEKFDPDILEWEFKSRSEGGDSGGHISKIRIIKERWKDKNPPKEWKDVHVECHCSCPAFQYWGPWRQSYIQRYEMEGEMPGNPSLPKRNLKFKDGVPYTTSKLCKHLLKAGQLLLKQKFPDWPEEL